MQIRREDLNKMVLEELQNMVEHGEIDEGWLDRLLAKGRGGLKRAGGAIQGFGQKAVGSAAGFVGAGDIGAQLTARGEETGEKAKAAGEARKMQSILSVHMEELNTDLTKLGLAGDPKVKQALDYLERAIESASAKAGEEYKRTAANELKNKARKQK